MPFETFVRTGRGGDRSPHVPVFTLYPTESRLSAELVELLGNCSRVEVLVDVAENLIGLRRVAADADPSRSFPLRTSGNSAGCARRLSTKGLLDAYGLERHNRRRFFEIAVLDDGMVTINLNGRSEPVTTYAPRTTGPTPPSTPPLTAVAPIPTPSPPPAPSKPGPIKAAAVAPVATPPTDLLLRCEDCDENYGANDLQNLVRHTMREHGRRPHREERAPRRSVA